MRLFRRSPRPLTGEDAVVRKVTDDLPRDGLFDQPLVVDRVRTPDPEVVGEGEWRVAFVVRVRDAAGKRCPDLAIDATIAGPHRSASGSATTDLMGQATFRMAGPPGTYRFQVDDVAAGALRWDAESSTTSAEAVVDA